MANTLKFGAGKWATGNDNVLGYNDENGNYKPLPFSVYRTSKGTVVNQNGLVEELDAQTPRIDFTEYTKGALLIEPSRTNLIINSTNFGNYSKSGSLTVTSNYGTSPDGSENSTRMQVPNSSNYYLYTSVSATAGTYVISLYIKGKAGQIVQLYNDGTAGGGGFTPCVLTGDWKRFERVVTTTGTGTLNPHILFGYGVDPNAQDIEVWGWQCERGFTSTSLILTQGSTATRTGDYAKIVNAPVLQASNQFTLFFDAKDFLLVNGTNTGFDNSMFNLGAGESPYNTGTGVHIYNRTWYWFDGSNSINLGLVYNAITDSKFAISYDGTKFTKFANGIKLGTYTASASMVNWDSISTGGSVDGQGDDRIFNLANLELYDTALTDAQLISKTSI